MAFDQIFPQLFIGTCPKSTWDIDILTEDYKVTAILSLQTDEDLVNYEINWNDLESYYREKSIEVRRVPVRDFDSDDLRKNLPACVVALNELLTNGHTVYLHCNAGINRSPSVAIVYLHWLEGQELDVAFEEVTRRHLCDPDMEAISLASGDRLMGSG